MERRGLDLPRPLVQWQERRQQGSRAASEARAPWLWRPRHTLHERRARGDERRVVVARLNRRAHDHVTLGTQKLVELGHLARRFEAAVRPVPARAQSGALSVRGERSIDADDLSQRSKDCFIKEASVEGSSCGREQLWKGAAVEGSSRVRRPKPLVWQRNSGVREIGRPSHSFGVLAVTCAKGIRRNQEE